MKFITKYTLRYMSLLLALVFCLGSASAGNSKKKAPQKSLQLIIEYNPAIKNPEDVLMSPPEDVLMSPSVKVLKGRTKDMQKLLYLNSNTIIAISSSGTIDTWDTTSWKRSDLFKDSHKTITCLLRIDEDRYAICFAGGFLKIRKMTRNMTTSETVSLDCQTEEVTCLLVIAPNRLAGGSENGTIRIWNIDSKECIQTLKGHAEKVTCLSLLDQDRMASGFEDGIFRIWNIKTWEPIKTLEVKTDFSCLSPITPNIFACTSRWDKDIKLFDSNKGECPETFKAHSKPITFLASFSTNPHIMVSGSEDGTIIVWNTRTKQWIQKINCKGVPKILGLSLDGKQAAIGMQDGLIFIADLAQSLWPQKESFHKNLFRVLTSKKPKDVAFIFEDDSKK